MIIGRYQTSIGWLISIDVPDEAPGTRFFNVQFMFSGYFDLLNFKCTCVCVAEGKNCILVYIMSVRDNENRTLFDWRQT